MVQGVVGIPGRSKRVLFERSSALTSDLGDVVGSYPMGDDGSSWSWESVRSIYMEMISPPQVLPISVEDFSRIHGVIRGVLAGGGVNASDLTRSCVFFALAGAYLLRRRHGQDASPAAGAALIAVSEGKNGLDILTYAKRDQNGRDWYSDRDAFHAWVEVVDDAGQKWFIDFTSPLYADAIRVHNSMARPGFKAFIRSASEMLHPDRFSDEAVVGDFFMEESKAHTAYLLQRAARDRQAGDLIDIASEWYVSAPSKISEYLRIVSNDGRAQELRFKKPRLSGIWTTEVLR